MSKEEFTGRLLKEQEKRRKKRNKEYRDYKAVINSDSGGRKRYGSIKGSRFMEV